MFRSLRADPFGLETPFNPYESMKKPSPIRSFVVAFLALLASLLNFAGAEDRKVDPDSIYARLGGQAAIDAAVDLFYEKMLADERVAFFFEDVNMKVQVRKQKEYLSAAFGGPEPWTGEDMRAAHADLDLKERDFHAVAENLQTTLEELEVDDELIREIMTLVGSLKDEVLNREPTADRGN